MTVKIYRVGGCVRDELMGIPYNDVDYSVEASSFEEMKEYIAARGKIFLEKPEYLTIRANIEGETRDYVLCRKEGAYSDGRHPDSVEMGTIYDDLARRDFTINAMAIDEAGKLIDPFQGYDDLKWGILRCVGKAEDRFNEDTLRMLRAIRFSITKNCTFDRDVRDYLSWNENAIKLRNISQDRIREELTKCFKFDTLLTLRVLHQFSHIENVLFNNSSIWLEPTTKKK